MEGGGGSGGSIRSIAEQKLKAFSIGLMGKGGRSKKELEDIKKRQDEEENARALKEFESTFKDEPKLKGVNKSWVKAGTFNAGNRKEDKTDAGTLYQPTSKLLENLGDQLDSSNAKKCSKQDSSEV